MSSPFTFDSKPLVRAPSPEHGSLALLARPLPAANGNGNKNTSLMQARSELLVKLPWNRDQPLRQVTDFVGQLRSARRGTPRSSHDASGDIDQFREYRKKRFDLRREKASKSGGGLKWGNEALRALRWGQVQRLWAGCLEKLWEIDDDEEAVWGVWGLLKKKLKRVGRALGLVLREQKEGRAGVQSQDAGEGW